MADEELPEYYRWDKPLKEIWQAASKPTSDTIHFKKLVLLSQLKSAEAQLTSAEAMTRYTRWLTAFTIVIAIATAIQAFIATLSYLQQRGQP